MSEHEQTGDAKIEVLEDPDRGRFTIYVDGEPAGFTGYRRRGTSYAFMHTEIEDAYGGRGLGSTLIRSALDTVRERGFEVEPFCPFVLAFVEKHPDYLALVPEERRAQFGLAAE